MLRRSAASVMQVINVEIAAIEPVGGAIIRCA
jgi:hypothetical protein